MSMMSFSISQIPRTVEGKGVLRSSNLVRTAPTRGFKESQAYYNVFHVLKLQYHKRI